MTNSYIFSSESVSEGHPDKVADQISDAILDLYLSQDAQARVACEVLVTQNFVCIAGEVRAQEHVAPKEIEAEARRVIYEAGYDGFDQRFGHETAEIDIRLQPQSAEISRAVDDKKAAQEQGAGDQGLMFGYATDETLHFGTESLMPAPITYAHAIVRELAKRRKDKHVEWLRPDAKSQVSLRYEDGVPRRIERIVVSTQHTPQVAQHAVRDYLLDDVLPQILPRDLLSSGWQQLVLVNPSGQFTEGGPATDTGLTGRKIIVDTYGGAARHGGGAFSGKDPSKVDRSAAYAARWVAKSIVAAKLANRCEIQIAYAIGRSQPVSILVETFGTGRLSNAELEALIRRVFDMTPYGITQGLNLLQPIYRTTATYGHFGRQVGESGSFTWEDVSQTIVQLSE